MTLKANVKSMNIFSQITQFIKRMLGQERGYSVQQVEDISDVRVKPNYIYIEKRGDKERWLHLACPSKCGDLISVNLMRSVTPFWTVSWSKDRKVTLSPSINKTDGCKSHFFIRESQIVWANSLPYSS